jgi:ABC-type sugar transport system substrate-binding protein
MKRLLATTALSLALALSVVVPAAMARPETRKAAVKVCHDLYVQSIKTADDSYNAAVKAANKMKGKERTDALAAATKARHDSKVQAKESEKTCIAKAPKK